MDSLIIVVDVIGGKRGCLLLYFGVGERALHFLEELLAVLMHHPPSLLLPQLFIENIVALLAKGSIHLRPHPPHILPIRLLAQLLIDRNDGFA